MNEYWRLARQRDGPLVLWRRLRAAALALGPARRRARDLLGAVAVVDPDVVAVSMAGVDLARTCDLLLGVVVALHPLSDPAGRPRDREDHGEHLGRDLERLVDDP